MHRLIQSQCGAVRSEPEKDHLHAHEIYNFRRSHRPVLTACGEDTKADAKVAGDSVSASASPTTPLEGLSPAEIASKSRLAMTKLRSFRMKGTGTAGGKEMTLDVAVAGKGNGLGTFGIRGGTGQVRWYGGYTYMTGDRKFWHALVGEEEGVTSQQVDSFVSWLAGRWLRKPVGSTGGDDAFPFCDTNLMFPKDTSDSRLTRGADTEVNSTRGVTLTGWDGVTARTLVVAGEGEPYCLRMSIKGGEEPQAFEFSGFNKPVPGAAAHRKRHRWEPATGMTSAARSAYLPPAGRRGEFPLPSRRRRLHRPSRVATAATCRTSWPVSVDPRAANVFIVRR